MPAEATYTSTVIPDDILLAELYRYLADPTGIADPSVNVLPAGKIALLVETGSGYGANIGSTYGTRGTSVQSQKIISHSFSLPDRAGSGR